MGYLESRSQDELDRSVPYTADYRDWDKVRAIRQWLIDNHEPDEYWADWSTQSYRFATVEQAVKFKLRWF